MDNLPSQEQKYDLILRAAGIVIFVITINFSILETAYAKAAYATCPAPASIYKVKGAKGVFTGVFAAPGGWFPCDRNLSSMDSSALYRRLPANFPKTIEFTGTTLSKNETRCGYSMDNMLMALCTPLKFIPYGDNWNSSGYDYYAGSDTKFKLFFCGRRFSAKNIHIDVTYCKFLPRE